MITFEDTFKQIEFALVGTIKAVRVDNSNPGYSFDKDPGPDIEVRGIQQSAEFIASQINERDERISALEEQLLAEREAYSKRAAGQVADGAVKLLSEELAEAQDEANQLRASYARVEAWGNALTEAAAAHAQTGSAWRVAARQLCDALGIDIGDTNDPYAGLQGAIEAVKALRAGI